MCPIIGLTDRTPSFKEIGRLRLGVPKSAGFPKEISYFRADFRPDAADAFATFTSIYGEKPTQINIRLPFTEIARCWDAYYEVYNTSGMLGMSDGERWLYLRHNKTGELLVGKDGIPSKADGLPVDDRGLPYMPFDRHTPVYSYKSKKGEDVGVFPSPTGRLKILIPELKRAAYVMVITHSVYNIMKISEQLAGVEAIAKNVGMSLPMVPMVLSRRKELISVTINGKKSMQEHYLLNIEIDPSWMEAQFKLLNTLLPGGPSPSYPALPATPDYAAGIQEEDLSENPGQVGEDDIQPDDHPDDDASKADEAHPPLNGSPRPYAPEVLKTRLVERSATYHGRAATQPQRNLVAMLLGDIFAGPDADLQRHALQDYLFGASSLKDISDAMILVMLNDWLKPTQDSGSAYHPDPMAVKEAQAAYQAAIVSQGQKSFPF